MMTRRSGNQSSPLRHLPLGSAGAVLIAWLFVVFGANFDVITLLAVTVLLLVLHVIRWQFSVQKRQGRRDKRQKSPDEEELEIAFLREQLAEQEMQNRDLQRSRDRAKQEIVAMDTIVREDVKILTKAKQTLVKSQSNNELSAPTLLKLMKSVSTLPQTGILQCAHATLTSHFADMGGTSFVVVLWQVCENETELVLRCLNSCCPDYPLTPILNSMKRVLPLSATLSTPETLFWDKADNELTVPDVEAAIAQSSSFGLYPDWPDSPLAARAIKSVYCIKIDDPVPPSAERQWAGILSVYANDPGFFGNDRNMGIVRPSIKLFVRVLKRECIRLWVNGKVQKDLLRLVSDRNYADEGGLQDDVEI